MLMHLEEGVALAKTKIFISYRHRNAAGYAGRLHDNLSSLPATEVFMDVDNIPPGVRFPEYIARAVRSCDVLLALIAPGWCEERDEDGGRRLDDPGDFVRMEIGAALRFDVLVVPVLLANAQMPDPDELPEDLAPLAERQALSLTNDQWPAGISRLLSVIRDASPTEVNLQAVDALPQLKVSPTILKFGSVPAGGDWPRRRIHVSNAGGGEISAKATTAEPWIVLRQEGSVVDVLIDPASPGERRGTIAIDSNGGSVDVEVLARIDDRRAGARRLLPIIAAVAAALVVLLVGAQLLAGNGATTIDVPAQGGWIDTGVTLEEGQRAVLTASGRTYTDVVGRPDQSFTPDGAPQRGDSPGDPMPDANHAALIARVGSRQFVVGRGPFTMEGAEGTILLRVNDDRLDDNQGKYSVTIRVTRPQQ